MSSNKFNKKYKLQHFYIVPLYNKLSNELIKYICIYGNLEKKKYYQDKILYDLILNTMYQFDSYTKYYDEDEYNYFYGDDLKNIYEFLPLSERYQKEKWKLKDILTYVDIILDFLNNNNIDYQTMKDIYITNIYDKNNNIIRKSLVYPIGSYVIDIKTKEKIEIKRNDKIQDVYVYKEEFETINNKLKILNMKEDEYE